MKGIMEYFEEYLSSVVFMVMLALAFVNVIFRNFATSISYTEEITTSLFVLLCLLGTSIAAEEESHLGLSVVTEFLPDKQRKIFAAAGNFLGTVFSIILLFTGIQMVIAEYELKQISIALQIPQWIYGSFLPFGAFWMAIRFGQSMLRNINDIKEENM